MSAEIQAWFQDYQQKQREEEQKLREEAHRRGRKEGERALLVRLLRARFGELSPAALARIEAAEIEELERCGERVLDAPTLAAVLGETGG